MNTKFISKNATLLRSGLLCFNFVLLEMTSYYIKFTPKISKTPNPSNHSLTIFQSQDKFDTNAHLASISQKPKQSRAKKQNPKTPKIHALDSVFFVTIAFFKNLSQRNKNAKILTIALNSAQTQAARKAKRGQKKDESHRQGEFAPRGVFECAENRLNFWGFAVGWSVNFWDLNLAKLREFCVKFEQKIHKIF